MSAQVVLWRRLHEMADRVVDVPPERHPAIAELVDKLARLIDTTNPTRPPPTPTETGAGFEESASRHKTPLSVLSLSSHKRVAQEK